MSRDGLVVETTGGWGGGEGGEGGEDGGKEVEEEKEEEVEAGDWDKLPNRWQRRRGRNSLSLLCRLLSSLSLLSPPSHHTAQSVLSFFHQSQCSLTIVPLVQWTLPGCDITYLLLCSFTFLFQISTYQTNMRHQMLFVMSQTLKYQIWKMSSGCKLLIVNL